MTNTVAYYPKESITAVKSFIVQANRQSKIKRRIQHFHNWFLSEMNALNVI
jgi:hypothetical protein